MKTYRIVTLGCRTNQYESQGFSDQLRGIGYVRAEDSGRVDLCIINTCAVTDGADASSRQEIRHLARAYPEARLVVTGCMAESAFEALSDLQGRLEIILNQDKEHLVEKLVGSESDLPEFKIERFDGHTRAFVKVQDGCNSFCTYCIIPYVRGRSRSRSLSDVVREVEGLVANGYREVVLTGINVGDYEDGQNRLADLIRAVDKIDGIDRIRISSIDPDEVNHDLADAILQSRHVCSNLHLVLQSGSNVVLKRMNRKYTRQMFLETVERLKKANRDFTFTTDAIVGFPGESEADFMETIEMVRQVKFAKVHMFPYSVRSRTRAALYPNRVPADVISRRKHQLLRVAEEEAFELRERFIGRRMNVLLEEGDENVLFGHTENFLRVRVQKGRYRPNDLVSVELYANGLEGLEGRIV